MTQIDKERDIATASALDAVNATSQSSVVPEAAQTAAKKNLPLIIAALMLTMLLSALGQTIFGAALPTIVGELGGVNHMSWVVTAFLLGQTISLPIFGKLGDQFGRKYLFMFSIALFVVGSAVGAMAQSMAV